MPQWNWQEPPIQIAPRRAAENIEPIAGGLADRPSPKAIGKFLRVVRSMNNDEEPDPNGPVSEVWAWLKELANAFDHA